ncbi:MAG: hypothetical protein ACK44A_12995 [Roseateles sp.]
MNLAQPLIAALLAALLPAHAAQQARQLSIELQVQGEEGWQDNGSWEKGQISQRFAVTTTLYSDGGLSPVNPLDPQARQQAEQRVQTQQAQVAAAQRRQRALAAAGGLPDAATQQQMNAAIASAYQRCGGNEACIRQAVMAAAPQLMAPPPGVSMAPGAELAGVAARADATEIYQPWVSEDACPGSLVARRDDNAQGLISDVGAARPRLARVQLDESGARAGLCHGYAMTIVDTRAQRLFIESFALPPLRARRSATGVQGETTVEALPAQIRQWADAQLRGVPLTGQRTATLTLTQPLVVSNGRHYAGRVTVTLNWRFA